MERDVRDINSSLDIGDIDHRGCLAVGEAEYFDDEFFRRARRLLRRWLRRAGVVLQIIEELR
jgi:hypothetical protein